MLVLSRKQGEAIVVGEKITLTVQHVRPKEIVVTVVYGAVFTDTYTLATEKTFTICSNVSLSVLRIHGKQVRLGFSAPDHIMIMRQELVQREQVLPRV